MNKKGKRTTRTGAKEGEQRQEISLMQHTTSSSAIGQAKKYPRLRRMLPVFTTILLWYLYRIFIQHPTSMHTHTPHHLCGNGHGNGAKRNTVPTSAASIDSIVVMDSLAYDKLRTIGGTGHWFHLLERLLPLLPTAAQKVWASAYVQHASASASSSTTFTFTPQHLYIVFQEQTGPDGLDSFGRLMLASILSGGLYDKVLIGHSTDVSTPIWNTVTDATTTATSESGDGSSKDPPVQASRVPQQKESLVLVENFVLSASLLFHPGEDIPYSEALGSVALHPDESSTSNTKDADDTTFNLCAPNLMTVSWDQAPQKRYDLLGENKFIYSLLHHSVDRACGWTGSGSGATDADGLQAGQYGTYGRKKDPFVEFMQHSVDKQFKEAPPIRKKKNKVSEGTATSNEDGDIGGGGNGGVLSRGNGDGEQIDPLSLPILEDNYLTMKTDYGSPLEQNQIQAQILQSALNIEQDDISLPKNGSRIARKLLKYRTLLCASHSGCNGTDSFMYATNAAGIQVHGWMQYSKHYKARANRGFGANNDRDNEQTIEEVKKLLLKRTSPILHNTTTDALGLQNSRIFTFPPVPAATDVPLTVLIYDRDHTRRLANIDFVTNYLKSKLVLASDYERHAYFPLHYSDENIPKVSLKKGIGFLGEESHAKRNHAHRRKKGDHVYDTSHHKKYDHNEEIENWVVDVLTHNEHDGHNEHIHVHGISGKAETAAAITAGAEAENIAGKSRFRRSWLEKAVDNAPVEEEREQEGEHELEGNQPKWDTKAIVKPRVKEFGNGRKLSSSFNGNENINNNVNATATATATASTTTTSKHHPPCQLIRTVKGSTVFITPHGFQSILMLFQPLKSLFIEVMPFSYNKPEIYGFIQAGMRAVPSFGEYRSYMAFESRPSTTTTKLFHWLGLTGGTEEDIIRKQQRQHWFPWEQSTCTNLAICRHVVRSQDVNMDEAFLKRVVDYIRNHYISNRKVKNIDFYE